jgi:putative holliday junction resolvase
VTSAPETDPKHDPASDAPIKTAPAGLLPLEAFAAALALAPKRPLIGIDVGTKTLGLSLSDVTLMIASSLETIWRVKFTPDAAHLIATAAKFNVCGFVVGLPINLDGSEGPRAQATRAFVRNLSKLTPLPMLFWDERWSTVAAERTLIEADTSRKRRAEVIDQVAATIILQGALDRMRELRRVQQTQDLARD